MSNKLHLYTHIPGSKGKGGMMFVDSFNNWAECNRVRASIRADNADETAERRQVCVVYDSAGFRKEG